MKIFIVILLSIHLVSGNTFLSELTKFTDLIEHFQEHQQKDASINWLTFLKMHYFDAQHQSSDQHHQHLPFQHHSSFHCIPFFSTFLFFYSQKRGFTFRRSQK